jgi:hypothetical protein
MGAGGAGGGDAPFACGTERNKSDLVRAPVWAESCGPRLVTGTPTAAVPPRQRTRDEHLLWDLGRSNRHSDRSVPRINEPVTRTCSLVWMTGTPSAAGCALDIGCGAFGPLASRGMGPVVQPASAARNIAATALPANAQRRVRYKAVLWEAAICAILRDVRSTSLPDGRAGPF